jgi:hypothetical protein
MDDGLGAAETLCYAKREFVTVFLELVMSSSAPLLSMRNGEFAEVI